MTRARRLWPPRWADAKVAVPVAVVLAYLWLFVLRGCGGPDVRFYTAPSTSSTVAPAVSAIVDFQGVPLPALDGTTTTTSVALAGRAHLSGSVMGPAGPLPGAVVRAERLVGDQVASADVVTGSDGRWDLPGVAGGRWRVRAWLAPAFAQTEPEILFLNATEERTLDLVVSQFSGPGVAVAVAPDPPQRGGLIGVAVQVAVRSVDADGVVRASPIVGRLLELTATGTWRLRGPNPAVTDGTGQATFVLECTASGPNRMQAVLRGTATEPDVALEVPVPDCVDGVATSSSAPGSTGSSLSTSSTSSTTVDR